MSAAEIDVVKDFMKALDNKDFHKAYSYLREDFVYSANSLPQPLNRHQFIQLMESLEVAMPDWSFNFHDVHQEGMTVHVKFRITGTNTDELILPLLDLPPLPATGKKLDMPEEGFECGVRDYKIFWLTMHFATGGGIPALLKQLGVEMPPFNDTGFTEGV
jgi:predicted ester cyclase